MCSMGEYEVLKRWLCAVIMALVEPLMWYQILWLEIGLGGAFNVVSGSAEGITPTSCIMKGTKVLTLGAGR